MLTCAVLLFRYGAHLSKEQVSELVAPHPDTLELVISWLEYNGVPPSSISTTHGGEWLTVIEVPVSQADNILGASYQLYCHAKTNDIILRTVSYTLPAVLHTHVQTVVPTTAFTSFLLQQTPRSRPGGEAAAQTWNATTEEPVNMLSRREPSVTPSVLRSMYKMEGFYPTERELNSLGVVGFENQDPLIRDLSNFMHEYRSDATYLTLDVKPINNLVGTGVPGIHSSLGAQYASALTYPTPVIYYRGIGARVEVPQRLEGRGDRYLEWLNYMTGQEEVPQTISMAYGSTSELSISPEYALSVCRLFGQLGSRGVSVLVASGDDGVGRGQCRNVFGSIQFYAGFPASCTYGI